MTRRPLHLEHPRTWTDNRGGNHVTAVVAGHEVDFESTTPLRPSPEALATAFLMPVMSLGRDLVIDGPVDPLWLENMNRIITLIREWWGFQGGEIRASTECRQEPAEGIGLFFGGGVDSLYALHHEQTTLTHLVFVEGFDIPLSDGERLEQVRTINGEIAAATGQQLITIRTDLRQHPLFRVMNWTNTVGAGLGACAHLLGGHLRRLTLAGDGHPVEINPWSFGTHHLLTSRWSSSTVTLSHHDAGANRQQKLNDVVAWPLGRNNLRVCWEFRRQGLNCGECEKCVRTQLGMLAAGISSPLPIFPAGSLLQRLDALEPVIPNTYLFYRYLYDRIDDPALRRAIDRLGVRSRRSWRFLGVSNRLQLTLKRWRWRLATAWPTRQTAPITTTTAEKRPL